MTSHKVHITSKGKTLTVELDWDQCTDQVSISCVTKVNAPKKKPVVEWYWYNFEHGTLQKVCSHQ